MTSFTEIATSGHVLFAVLVSVLAGGLVSFASPCVVPLVPGYLSYLAAIVGVDDEARASGKSVRTCGSPAPRVCLWLASRRCS